MAGVGSICGGLRPSIAGHDHPDTIKAHRWKAALSYWLYSPSLTASQPQTCRVEQGNFDNYQACASMRLRHRSVMIDLEREPVGIVNPALRNRPSRR